MKKLHDEIDAIEFLDKWENREKFFKWLQEEGEREEIDQLIELIEKSIKRE